jgi:hypothetical protein
MSGGVSEGLPEREYCGTARYSLVLPFHEK